MTPIRTVGIVGAGTMGRRIAFGCIIRGVPARLCDVSPSILESAVEAVRQLVKERVADGRLVASTDQTVDELLAASPTLEECVSGADLVIEAVPEEVDLKRDVFAQIDRCASAETLIATNTSSIPGSWLADATARPEKCINLNFGTPDHPKVEVMAHRGTAAETTEAVVEFLQALGLVPIVARKEIQGYPTNRIWRAVKKEVLFLLDGGYSTPDEIDRAWMLDWGTPIGPCGLMDKVGLDVVRDIESVYYRASGDPSDQPPRLLLDLITQGKLGEKSGEGFYTYPDPAYQRPGWLTGRVD